MSMEGSQSMCRKRAAYGCALVAIVMTLGAGDAVAGEYAVANCQADPLNFSTQAFDNFATRGMKIRRACNPEGPGLRGLITSNVVRDGRVQRGAVALVTITAPSGTRFTRFRWAGTARRRDCRYALQLWADADDIAPIPLKNVRANRRCPRPGLAQAAGYRSRTFDVTGATQIVQRVICVGGDGRNSCSSRGSNYLRTYKAQVGIADPVPPTATILADTPLARGEWVSGTQPLNYDASDNVGVRSAEAIASGRTGGFEQRPCAFAVPDSAFADGVPCPNGPGHISVDTSRLLEGTQSLSTQVHDSAGNLGYSPASTARIDNTPPGRVDVAVEGGDGWRKRNDFVAAWANAAESDRAPIAAVGYRLCATGTANCNGGEQTGDNISRIGMQVPAPGEWTLSLWRRDAAGNDTEAAASAPVTLRYDPEPPQLGFEASSTTDPTLVSVSATDAVSGLAHGAIEISPVGSGIWQALPTQKDGSRLIARVDDSALPAGSYQLRGRAVDQAGNEASTDRRLDGQVMSLTLPLRIESRMRAGFQRVRTIRERGNRKVVTRRVTVLKHTARVVTGGHARIVGRLVNRDGQGIEVVRDLVELEVAVLPPRPLALRAFGVSKSTEDRRNRHEEATRREGRHGLGGVGESAACADPAGARRARRGGAGGAARAQRRCRARRRA
jgi:hypothetical protein